MVQKSCSHQLRLVIFPHDLQGFIHQQAVLAGFLVNTLQYIQLVYSYRWYRKSIWTNGLPSGRIPMHYEPHVSNSMNHNMIHI